MRVFILSTGRCGSTTIVKACQHISNYTAAHESLAKKFGEERLNYSDNHIESDNRLSWFLGQLDEKFGDEPIFVHLLRDKEATVKSYNKRWIGFNSIVRAYCEAIHMRPSEVLQNSMKLQVTAAYYDTVNTNIRHFLKDKSKKMTMRLENIKEDFPKFWSLIGAEGDLEAALAEFDIKYNKTKSGNSRAHVVEKPSPFRSFLLRTYRSLKKIEE